MIRFIGIIFIYCLFLQNMSAGSGVWRTYTAMNEPRDAVEHEGYIYVATSGGMYSYSKTDGSMVTFTPSDGLSTTDLRAITADDNGTVWIGAAGGVIDGLNPSDRTWIRITDITRTDITHRDITALVSRGDTIYVGTSYGVSVYTISRNEFNDSYIKLGAFPTQTPVTSIAYDERNIWIGTAIGLASGAINDPLLAAPDRWKNYTTSGSINDRIPHNMINDVVVYDGTTYIATPAGLAWYNGVSWNPVDNFVNTEVYSLEVSGEWMYAATGNTIYRIAGDGSVSAYGPELPATLKTLVKSSEDGIVAVMADQGIGILKDGIWETFSPEGPRTNLLTNIAIDPEGIIWIATAPSGAGRGFYRYDPAASEGETWKSYTNQQYSGLRGNAYHKIMSARDGTVWASSWGSGFTSVSRDGTLRNYYIQDGLAGIVADTNFVVTSLAGEDNEGNIWVSLYLTHRNRPLARINPETSEVTTFRNERNPNATSLRDITVDRFNTVWIISTGSPEALFYYNDYVSIGNNVDGWGMLTTANGLPSNTVRAVVEDNRGEIWLGTSQGLAVIVNPREPQTSIRDIFTLFDQNINTIEVDPLNRKWVGTREGVFLLSPDGTQLLAHYNVENTNNNLVSNDILSIAFDDNTGIVYFGTERGMSSLQTVAVAPVASFNELFISPNPYLLPSDHEIKIDGLVRNSSVKIMSVDGRLVRSFDSPGGRVAYWDGRDDSGREVASGVYIVIGISEDGTDVGKSKVTVIRR